MKVRYLLLVVLIGLLSLESLAQQSSSGRISFGGAIGEFAMISPLDVQSIDANDSGEISAQLVPAGYNKILMRLTGSAHSSNSTIAVRFLLRSNCKYEFRSAISGGDFIPSITASIRQGKPTGSGVISTAMTGLNALAPSAKLSSSEIILATGTRISTGSVTSPRNAIEIEMVLRIEKNDSKEWSAELSFSIQPAR